MERRRLAGPQRSVNQRAFCFASCPAVRYYSYPMAAPVKAPKPNLASVYDELQSVLQKHAPPFTARTNAVRNKRNYILVSEKEVVIDGRKKPEMWFAGIIEQKGYIGFYYMPIYCVPNMKSLSPGLMKLLKGKSCFYIKSITPELCKDIDAALKSGLAAYKKIGWV